MLADQSITALPDQVRLAGDRMHEILITGSPFDDIYRHVLAVPGKRLRTRLVLGCAQLIPAAEPLALRDTLDLACVMEMLHEASLIHDDVCDGSLQRRGSRSVAAAFGVRTAAKAGFHVVGSAFQVLARVIADNPAAFGRLGDAHGVTYLDQLADLSLGQLVETISSVDDEAALRRHYEFVTRSKTGTLFRLCCSYGGTSGGVDDDRLRALMRYADEYALAFQIMDDVRDVEGGQALGKDSGGDLGRRVPTWPVIEWLAMRPGSREMWLTGDTSSAVLQADLVRSGATRAARAVAAGAARRGCRALDVFPPSPAREHLCDLATQTVLR